MDSDLNQREEDFQDDDDDVYLHPQGHYEEINHPHDLRIQSNFSEVDYPEVNVVTPGSTNTSILMKKSGIKSPPSQIKER